MQRIARQVHSNISQPLSNEDVCPNCKGNGWICYEENGYSMAKKCHCQIEQESLARIANSGLSNIMDKWTLDTYTTTAQWQKNMKETVVKYLDAIKNGEKQWLFIGGAVGSGKSHLCTAACGELIKQKKSVRYFQWSVDARNLKGLANDPEAFEDALYKFKRADVLYIDDLFKSKRGEGTELNPTDADVRLAFELINGRYVEDKLVVMSSEWMLTSDLMMVDEGTFSRVYEKTKGFRIEVKREKGRNYRVKDDEGF